MDKQNMTKLTFIPLTAIDCDPIFEFELYEYLANRIFQKYYGTTYKL